MTLEEILIWIKKHVFKIGSYVFVFVILFILTLASILTIETAVNDEDGGGNSPFGEMSSSGCNVQGVELHGTLLTYIPKTDYTDQGNLFQDESSSEDIVYKINAAENDDSIKAVLLEIDSWGGLPVAAEEISVALKGAKKPNIALIRSAGASGAYWAATGTDKIFASKNSDIGSIGVTSSYLDNAEKNKKEGLTYNDLSAGKFKDTGSTDRPLSPEEVKLLKRDINIVYDNFIKAVADNRNIDIEKVRNLADGSTMLGDMALQNQLIDYIGGIPEVENYLQGQIGEAVSICW